jgi:thiol-disulfide isomerase/thioredoxin
MVLTASTMLPLGTPLPGFSLPQVAGDAVAAAAGPNLWSSANLDARPVLVLFLCAHCPFVKHIEPELTRLEHDYGERLQIVAISSNSTVTHPQDGPEGLRAQAERCGWRFPYLFDASQAVAHAFQAACTPDLFLFDARHQLAYRGQLDGCDLRAALDALLAGQAVNPEQRASIGCNIKWHPAG